MIGPPGFTAVLTMDILDSMASDFILALILAKPILLLFASQRD